MLELINISKKFKTDFWSKEFTALESVNFEIPEGKIVGFLGANGAGKTTLIKIIMGFIKPNRGNVKFDHKLGKNRNEIFNNLGYFPERPYFYPSLTGKEFLEFVGQLNGMKKASIQFKVKEWSQRFNMEKYLDRIVRSYSKGMLQRLGLISSVLHDPLLVILDEPLSGLDPLGRKEIRQAIGQLKDEGKTVFFSSHIIPDLEEVCDRVVFMESGKVKYSGEIDSLLSSNNQNFKIRVYSDCNLEIKSNVVEKKRTEKIINFEVSASVKDAFLAEVLSQGAQILSVSLEIKSLEQVFYAKENLINV